MGGGVEGEARSPRRRSAPWRRLRTRRKNSGWGVVLAAAILAMLVSGQDAVGGDGGRGGDDESPVKEGFKAVASTVVGDAQGRGRVGGEGGGQNEWGGEEGVAQVLGNRGEGGEAGMAKKRGRGLDARMREEGLVEGGLLDVDAWVRSKMRHGQQHQEKVQPSRGGAGGEGGGGTASSWWPGASRSWRAKLGGGGGGERQEESAKTRQAASGNANPGIGPGQAAGTRCLTSNVQRPDVGECKELFTKPVPLSTCVADQETADLRAKWSLERLSIADLGTTPWVGAAQNFVNFECRKVWKDWSVPPSFLYTCYGGSNEMQPCEGSDDYFTCTLGTCIRLSDRPDWPVDWWNVLEWSVYGGIPPVRYDVRNWYCANNPAIPLGEIDVGNLGKQIYYAFSSNPFVGSECDTKDPLGNTLPQSARDAQCQGVTEPQTAFPQCCGSCILNTAHLMRMYNCTGLKDIIGDDQALDVLANYCRKTVKCVEERPCTGDPVVMGDPKIFLNPSTYNIQCDQMDSGCWPDGTHCKFRWACDNRLESLRERLGIWGKKGEVSAALSPSPARRWVLLPILSTLAAMRVLDRW